jgi:hypothetical protein
MAARIPKNGFPERRPLIMVSRRITLPLALAVSLAVALPAGAAQANSGTPLAHSAGGDAAAPNPAIVGVPLARADKAINNAADAIDAGNGAQAVGPLRASRRYMIRAYRGAKYLIAATPPAPVEDGSAASAARFVRLAHRAVRASHHGRTATGSWIRAKASGGAVGPAFADTPTAVFSVFQGQYDVATAAVGMLPDVQGGLLARVKTSLYTAIVLRNRLVKVVAAAEPPAPPEDARATGPSARAAQDDVVTFATVMPGLTVLLDDEMQQMTATQQDTTVPAASSAVLANALAADQQIEAQVNLLWPPVVDD